MFMTELERNACLEGTIAKFVILDLICQGPMSKGKVQFNSYKIKGEN